MEVTIKTDFREALRALDQIDNIFTQKRVVQASLRDAMKPMLVLAKAKAAKNSGALAESLKIQTFRRGRNLGNNIARAVIRSKYKDKRAVNLMLNYYGIEPSRVRRGVRHAHLVEFGYRARSGRQIGARPFLRPAFDLGIKTTISTFRDRLGVRTKKELARIAKR